MSKYLAIARGFNEPDNNTPSDEKWCADLVSEVKKVREEYA